MEPQQNNTNRPKQTIQPVSHDLENTTINTVNTPDSLYPTASNDFSGSLVEDTTHAVVTPNVSPTQRPHIRRIFAILLLIIILVIVGSYLLTRM